MVKDITYNTDLEARAMYKVNKGGSFQTWYAHTRGSEVVATFGKLNGKLRESTYFAEAKNIGKANETTPESQATVEVDALYVKQFKNKHYRYSTEDAEDQVGNCKVPMKIKNYKDNKGKVIFPCYVGTKFNGSRLMCMDSLSISKAGIVEDFKHPSILDQVAQLSHDIDSEVYRHGFSLQRIQSARNKLNVDSDELMLKIFDIPVANLPIEERIEMMKRLKREIRQKGLNRLEVEIPVLVNNEVELQTLIDKAIADGYECVVIWNTGGTYEFGVRTSHVYKWKPRYDAEWKVVDCLKDKNGQGVLDFEINDTTFKAKMKGDAESRSYENQILYVGEWVTVEYEEFSDSGIPTKPVAQQERKCDNNGEPLE